MNGDLRNLTHFVDELGEFILPRHGRSVEAGVDFDDFRVVCNHVRSGTFNIDNLEHFKIFIT